MQKTFFKRYCDDCLAVHWIEVTASGKEICHGYEYFPRETPAAYTKHAPGGGIAVIEKIAYRRPIDPGFQMLIDEHSKTS